MKTRNLLGSIVQGGQTTRASPYLCPPRSAAARYTSRACSARAEKPCPGQWESQQEANFFCCLDSQFSPWASPGAALSLWPRSAASPGPPRSFGLLPRAGSASCLCCHAPPLLLAASFLRCSVWLLPHSKPLFLDSFPEYRTVRISECR